MAVKIDCLPPCMSYSLSRLAWAFVLVSGLSVVLIFGFANYTSRTHPKHNWHVPERELTVSDDKGKQSATRSFTATAAAAAVSGPKHAVEVNQSIASARAADMEQSQSDVSDTDTQDKVAASRSNSSSIPDTKDCFSWEYATNWNKPARPKIELDPNKFLYPGLIWGPNNQAVGFWQSIYLAIRLNRTLVLPCFYAHVTTGPGEIPAEQRIDVERLRKFVSVVPIDFLRKQCNGSFDVVFQSMAVRAFILESFERSTGMNILHIASDRVFRENGSTALRMEKPTEVDPPSNIPAFPSDAYKLTYEPWITGERSTLRKAYNSTLSCALYSAPFNTIRLKLPKGVAQPLGELKRGDAADGELLAGIIDAVRRPPAVVETARGFQEAAFDGERYVAVHWRYDMADWGKSRCRPDNANKYSRMCDELRNITAQDVASGIAAALDKAKVNRTSWRYVYIASPPILRDFTDDVVAEMRGINGNVRTAKTSLERFLHEGSETCWKKASWRNGNEIFALTEMEVLAKSEWLFFASGSTFSSTVQPTRWEIGRDGDVRRKYERSVFDVARKAMMARIGVSDSKRTRRK